MHGLLGPVPTAVISVAFHWPKQVTTRSREADYICLQSYFTKALDTGMGGERDHFFTWTLSYLAYLLCSIKQLILSSNLPFLGLQEFRSPRFRLTVPVYSF